MTLLALILVLSLLGPLALRHGADRRELDGRSPWPGTPSDPH